MALVQETRARSMKPHSIGRPISSMTLRGIYISNYPASDAANRLAGIIIEEPENWNA